MKGTMFWIIIDLPQIGRTLHVCMMYLLQAKDEDSFFRYVHLFVEYFSCSHNNDKDLELSQLPESLLKELSEYLNRQTYSKLSGLTVKQRTHTICAVRCLSTLARYVMMKLPLEWLVEASTTCILFFAMWKKVSASQVFEFWHLRP